MVSVVSGRRWMTNEVTHLDSYSKFTEAVYALTDSYYGSVDSLEDLDLTDLIVLRAACDALINDLEPLQ
jgi:hypothetical protein